MFLSALAIQAAMLAFRLETIEEAKVILIFHIVGTVWVYPEASLFRIGGEAAVLRLHVASIGSYIARVWRLFDLRFTHHPPLWAVVLVGIAIYVNFFAHHFIVDIRYGLFAVMALMFGRTMIYFKI